MKAVKRFFLRNKGMTAVMLLVILAVCYFVSINGEINDDATYYIGLINTTLTTDSIYQYNVYNGYLEDSLYLRRLLATFEIHSAVLCQLFEIPALIFARIFRACQNVILTSCVVFLFGKELFVADERKESKAAALVIAFLYLQFVFVGNIYTTSAFFITRAYEGKAFAANVVILFLTYLCMQFHKTKNKKYLLLILLTGWGGIAISASAMILIPVGAAVLLIPYQVGMFLYKKRQEKYHINE